MRLSAFTLWIALIGCHSSDIDPMERQPKVLPYTRTPMRLPPPGTVPLESPLGPPELLDGLARTDFVKQIPVPVTRELMQLGKRRFEITCAACHGVLGDGQSPVARKMALRPPPSLHDPTIPQMSPGAIFRVITFGYGLMPAFGAEIPVHERWAVIAFLRALERSQRATLADAPPDIRRALLAQQKESP